MNDSSPRIDSRKAVVHVLPERKTRKAEPLTIDVSFSDTEPTGTALAPIPPTVVRKSKRRKVARSDKPYDEFPLTKHPGGKWQKKIRGTIHYFGRWYKTVNGKKERLPDDGWQAALALYKAQADDLHAGRTPRVNKTGDGLTLNGLRERFLTAKSRALDAGEITRSTYFEYRAIADLLIAQFGKDRLVDDITADDFEALRAIMAESWGPVRLGNAVQRVRTLFKYGYEAGLIEKPIRYGSQFKKPSASVLRRHRNKNRAENGANMLEPHEIQRLLRALTGEETETGKTNPVTGKPHTVTIKANPAIRAMVLLGVNCGFIGKDCADLPMNALDLKRGWIDFPRPKTGIARRCPLWPETVEALKAAIANRPEPCQEQAKPLVFVTDHGRQFLNSSGTANPVSVLMRAAMKDVDIHRKGIGPATFRHVFEMIGGGTPAQTAQVSVNYIMGHADDTIADHYREAIEDNRLRAVVDHVHNWLFPVAPNKEGGAA